MKETNNKGFSLVELVIVIAIMAVLVVVIAPQYTRFVKQSRVSTDIQTAADFATALNVAVATTTADKPVLADKSGVTDKTVTFANVYDLDAFPLSKLTSNNTAWKVYGDNSKGVTKITLTVDTTEYEVWPDSVKKDPVPTGAFQGLEALNGN